MNLAKLAHAVRTREDLIVFLDALRADLAENREAWTNLDLPAYLSAMASWSRDMEGYYEGRDEDVEALPPWRVLVDLLMAARVYE